MSPEKEHGKQSLSGKKYCQCPLNCPYCGRRRSKDSIGHYCKTRNCQYSLGYAGCGPVR